jgi:hypothetical protein
VKGLVDRHLALQGCAVAAAAAADRWLGIGRFAVCVVCVGVCESATGCLLPLLVPAPNWAMVRWKDLETTPRIEWEGTHTGVLSPWCCCGVVLQQQTVCQADVGCEVVVERKRSCSVLRAIETPCTLAGVTDLL